MHVSEHVVSIWFCCRILGCASEGLDKLLLSRILYGCRALELAGDADAMLVVGSSLMVYSAFRLAKATKAAGSPLALCVVGPTRADDLADLKVEALAGEAMTRLASHPSLLVPRPV